MGETNVDVDASAKIIFDESFFAQRNLSFTVNASGDLIVTV